MTEQQLRALVRDAIAKAGVGGADGGAKTIGGAQAPPYGVPAAPPYGALFTLPPGDPDGRCMIEPGVACNHCGYCKSYGH
jgi:hypothetical protein